MNTAITIRLQLTSAAPGRQPNALVGGPATGTAAEPARDFHDENTALFTRRQEIQAALDCYKGTNDADLTIADRRKRNRLTAELDRVTADIVHLNWGLVHNYVKRFTSHTTSNGDRDDFTSAGITGLMRAINSYDPTMGKFGQWAYKPIQREVLEAVHAADHSNMNRGDWERRAHVLRAISKIQAEKGPDYSPGTEEIANLAGLTAVQVQRSLEAPRIEPLSAPVGDEYGTTLADFIADPGETPEDLVLSHMALESIQEHGLPNLDPREVFVVVRRFGLDGEPPQKLSSIGDILGLSREAVRQVEAKALAKIGSPPTLRKIVRERSSQSARPQHGDDDSAGQELAVRPGAAVGVLAS